MTVGVEYLALHNSRNGFICVLVKHIAKLEVSGLVCEI